jgi:hypothetical protein
VKDGATLQRLRDGARRSAAQWTKERHVARLDQVFAKAAVPLAIGHAS